MRQSLLANDGAHIVRISTWSNAESSPAAIQPNLLAQTPIAIHFVPSGDWGGVARLALDAKFLTDGNAEPPAAPWIPWHFLGFFAETSPDNYLLIDTMHTQLRVTGVSFFDDPAHPESWLRDALFESWDAAREQWNSVHTLLSDIPVHTHKFAQPVEAARFRIRLPWGVVGNIRLGEIVFHGDIVGNSHPDAAAKKPVAVLFDEQDDIKHCLIHSQNGLDFQFDRAYAGGRCFHLRAGSTAIALFQHPFGHVISHWNFDIAEYPQPGQYRYLQFAWRAISPNSSGITLGVSGDGWNAGFHAGEYSAPGEWIAMANKVGQIPPAQWTVQRVDLWDILKKPARLNSMWLGAKGGDVAFDQILLGRTEADLRAHASARK
jgi:hypothetical protein